MSLTTFYCWIVAALFAALIGLLVYAYVDTQSWEKSLNQYHPDPEIQRMDDKLTNIECGLKVYIVGGKAVNYYGTPCPEAQ